MSECPVFVFNNQIITNGSMSGNITSLTQDISSVTSISVQCTWTGTSPVGTASLYGSLDNITFTAISDSSLSVSGNSGSNLWNYDLPAFPYIQLVYTFGSGTGTMNAKISGKRE